MRFITRYTAAGVAVAAGITVVLMLGFPYFITGLYEIAGILAIGGVIGLVASGVMLAVRKLFRRTASRKRRGRALAVAASGVVVAVAVYAAMTPVRSWHVSPRFLALGVDGGTWTVIDPLLEEGRLPTLANLKASGTSATLMSEEPMFSMILWTTIGAGVHPDKHGIHTFYDTQDHLRSKRFWEVFEDEGHSIGLFRWWITWPPRVKNGFCIPGILARDATAMPPAYHFVNELRMEMKAGHRLPFSVALRVGWHYLRYGLRLDTCVAIAREVLPAMRTGRFADFHIASRRAEIRLNTDIYCNLLREFEPEFTCFYDNGVDQMSHFYWQYYRPGDFDDVPPEDVARYGNAIPDYYALQDEMFGRILAHIDEGVNVVVLSDHGFGPVEEAANFFFTSGVPVLADMGMDDDYYSVALASRTFVESVKRDPAVNAEALDHAVDVFNSLRVIESGERIFRAWIEDEGRVQLDVSDSLTSLEGHVETADGPVPVRGWFTTRIYTGTHDPRGIFVGAGAPFRRGHRGETAELVDIAPTVLYISDSPVSRELDGHIMWDWIAPEFRSSHDVARVDTYGHYDPSRADVEVDRKTMDKLRALGYVR